MAGSRWTALGCGLTIGILCAVLIKTWWISLLVTLILCLATGFVAMHWSNRKVRFGAKLLIATVFIGLVLGLGFHYLIRPGWGGGE